MRTKMSSGSLVALVCALVFSTGANADGPPESGFFDDYSLLEPSEATWADYIYVTDRYQDQMTNLKALIVTQPEIFIADDSKYKGMKPDDMVLLSNSVQQIFSEELSKGYQIANSAGENTVVLRLAMSNINLKKKPRTPVVGWLPPVFLMTTLKRGIVDDFADKILLTEMVWEAEITDSQTGEIYGQLLLELGNAENRKEFTSWDELVVAVTLAATRLRCRLDNAPRPVSERQECMKITEADLDIFVEEA